MTKPELLAWLGEEYQQWQALLDQIGPERMELPGVNGAWSMKDIVAHLTGWNHWFVARLQAAERGEPEPPPPWPAQLQSEDHINAWIYQTNRKLLLREVLEDMRQVHQQVVTIIKRLPDDVRIDLVEPGFYRIWIGDQRFLAGEFFHHYHDDHEADVSAWLAQIDKQ